MLTDILLLLLCGYIFFYLMRSVFVLIITHQLTKLVDRAPAIDPYDGELFRFINTEQDLEEYLHALDTANTQERIDYLEKNEPFPTVTKKEEHQFSTGGLVILPECQAMTAEISPGDYWFCVHHQQDHPKNYICVLAMTTSRIDAGLITFNGTISNNKENR